MAIAKWKHLNTFRTQKLSTSTAKIVGPAPAKIASCRIFYFLVDFWFNCMRACEHAYRRHPVEAACLCMPLAGSFFYGCEATFPCICKRVSLIRGYIPKASCGSCLLMHAFGRIFFILILYPYCMDFFKILNFILKSIYFSYKIYKHAWESE